MTFISVFLEPLFEVGLLDEKNIKDISPILLLYSGGDVQHDIISLMLEKNINVNSMMKNGQCLKDDVSLIKDFEIAPTIIQSKKNIRIRGGHPKITSYIDYCNKRLLVFQKQIFMPISCRLINIIQIVCHMRLMDASTLNTQLIVHIAMNNGQEITLYQAAKIAYYLRTGRIFNLMTEHIVYMKFVYIDACCKLLSNPAAVSNNIPDPIALIQISIMYYPVCKFDDLRSILMMIPINTSKDKIKSIGQIIMNNVSQ